MDLQRQREALLPPYMQGRIDVAKVQVHTGTRRTQGGSARTRSAVRSHVTPTALRRSATVHRYRRTRKRTVRRLLLITPLLLLLWLATTHLLALLGITASSVSEQTRLSIVPLHGSVITVSGGPSLNAAMVDALLTAYHSPLRGHGADIVALSKRYRIDDAAALAFFVMESRAGTEGEAVLTHSFGNLRPKADQPQLDGYRLYRTWMEGATEWFSTMRGLYVDTMGRRQIEAIVPVYAPASDSNDPASMTAGIRQLVSCWRGDVTQCPDQPAAVHDLVTAATRV